jgi:hypothetical protein
MGAAAHSKALATLYTFFSPLMTMEVNSVLMSSPRKILTAILNLWDQKGITFLEAIASVQMQGTVGKPLRDAFVRVFWGILEACAWHLQCRHRCKGREDKTLQGRNHEMRSTQKSTSRKLRTLYCFTPVPARRRSYKFIQAIDESWEQYTSSNELNQRWTLCRVIAVYGRSRVRHFL